MLIISYLYIKRQETLSCKIHKKILPRDRFKLEYKDES